MVGWIVRSIERVGEVREASKTDPLLRGAISLVAAFPLYTAAGYICSVNYDRYLKKREKRLARARACGARLMLSIEKEKAEEVAWQMDMIQALARQLGVLETRLGIQSVGESKGEVFIRLMLSSTDDAQADGKDVEPCDVLWTRVQPSKQAEGPLSAVTRVVIDGSKGDESEQSRKVYSFWLAPSKKPKEACVKAIKDLSEKHGGPEFEPHVTLLGAIEGEEETVKASAEAFAKATTKVPLSFKRVALGGSYFRSVVMEAELSEELSAAHTRARASLPNSWLPEVFGGRGCKWLDAKTKADGFCPHLSIAYTEKPPASPSPIEKENPSLMEDAAFLADEVQVWETDSSDKTCKSWKKIASFKLQNKKPASFFKMFFQFSRYAAPEFLQIGLGTCLSLSASIVVDMACKHDTDLYSGKYAGKSNAELRASLIHGLCLWGACNQLWNWSSILTERAGKKIGSRLKEQLYEKLLNQDVKWIQQKGADELYKTLMQRSDNVERMFTREVPGIIRMSTDFVVNIGLLWLSRPRLCAFGFGLFAFQNMNNGMFDTIYRIAKDHDKKVNKVKENALEVLQNFRVVRAFVREDKEKQAFKSSLRNGMQVQRSDIVEKFTSLGNWFGYEFTFQVAYLYGGMLVNIGYIMPEEVKDVVQKTFKSMWPLYQLKFKLMDKSTFVEDSEAVLEALERLPEIPFEDDTKYNPKPEDVRGEIEAEDMFFSYADDPDECSLKGMSFKIPAGSMVGLVGPSGCGKSTLFSVLLRFYDPIKGGIKVDGVDLVKWNPQALYRSIAWVSQDQAVFAGSILDNIRYGVPDASEADVLEAMKQAALYDDVMKKEKGVLTMASELSGGQKQRLSIARAFLRNPKILLLDEATSALDTGSERKVQKAFETLMKGRTVIAIAHRLSTIMNSDLIMVVEDGKLIEQGTHADLLKKSGGKYADLVHQQLAVDDDKAKAETPTDPKAVQDCALDLQGLCARVPAELRPEVDKAIQSLKAAAATLQNEKKRLALKERSLVGHQPWRAAKNLRTAMQAVRRMRVLAGGNAGGECANGTSDAPPTIKLDRALSNVTRLEDAADAEEAAPVPIALQRAGSA